MALWSLLMVGWLGRVFEDLEVGALFRENEVIFSRESHRRRRENQQ